jgi:tetratricopeptide (TPR) repeat protein
MDIDALFYEACLLHRRGLLAESASLCDSILKLQPHYCDASHLSGIIAVQSGAYLKAAEFFANAVADDAKHPAYHSNLGLALQKLNRLDEALASLNSAISLKPDYAEAFYNRGIVLQQLDQPNAAIDDYDRALFLKPDYFQAYSNRGIALTVLRRNAEAVASFDQALVVKPNYVEAYSNRGKALLEMEHFEAAIESCDQAIRLKHDYAEAHFNRGIALKALGQLVDAIASYDRAIAIRSTYAEAHYNRGNALQGLKCLDSAIESFDRAIAIDPDYIEANWNKGFTLLLNGEFRKGLSLYEWRWKKKDGRKLPYLGSKPRWQGNESLNGKSIFVYAEQGLGDTIQFCRYLSMLKETGANPQSSEA